METLWSGPLRGRETSQEQRSKRVLGEVIRRVETFGQIACAVGRLPIRFTVGTGGTIFYCRAESASFVDSAVPGISLPAKWGGGDLRSDRVRGRETTHPFHGGHRRHDQATRSARWERCDDGAGGMPYGFLR